MTNAERKERSLNRLLDAAAGEIARSGIEGFSLSALCSSEGITKGLLYHYFQSKEDLILAAVERTYRRLNAAMGETATEPCSDPAAYIARYSGARRDFFASSPADAAVFASASSLPPSNPLKAKLREIRDREMTNNKVFLDNIAAAWPLRIPSEKAKTFISMTLDGVFSLTTGKEAGAIEDALASALDVVLFGLVKRG